MQQLTMRIGGERVSAISAKTLESIQPGNGVAWATLPAAGPEDVDRAVRQARLTFERGEWSRATPAARAKIFFKLADLLSEATTEIKFATLETTEWGRVCAEALPAVRAFTESVRFFAAGAAVMTDVSRALESASLFNVEKRVPLGVIGAILPWNSPLTLAGYKIIPALLMGNSVVAKPSEFCSAPLLELAGLLERAGLPAGVLNVVTGDRRAGESLAAHPGIDKISFTGSLEVGIEVYKHAAGNLKRAVFELGGKSATLIFSDANLDRATTAALAVFRSAGQACIAPSRLLVENSVYDEVVDQVVKKTQALPVGDPWNPKVRVGPVRNAKQQQKILGAIARGKKDGAHLLLGGGIPDLPKPWCDGWYVAPTIFTDVKPGSALEQEEIFGPVLSILKVENEDEAVSIANGTKYGLAAGAWTRDLSRAHRLADRLEAGTVWINTHYHLSPRVPFGGTKKSGIGRECSLYSFEEVSEVKNVVMELNEN